VKQVMEVMPEVLAARIKNLTVKDIKGRAGYTLVSTKIRREAR
jgi:hypothetical protein